MQIEITYDDGGTETVDVRLMADTVLTGDGWRPGYCVQPPTRCYFRSDLFESFMNEQGETEGRIEQDEDEIDDDAPVRYESFDWKLVGNPEDECRGQIAKWLSRLGRIFDGSPDQVPDGVGPEGAAEYVNDATCWAHYLDDHQAEIERVASMVGLRASGPRPN